MPLRDHFHSPVNDKHRWDAVHGQWPAEIVRTLFELLPPGYIAESQVYHGAPFEVDVSVVEEDDRPDTDAGDGSSGNATLPALEPPWTVVAEFPRADEYEVRVYDDTREQTLVAAVEIVSPSNKDRSRSRNLFVSKAAALLNEGVCVSIVDIVTDQSANLYSELMSRVGQPDSRFGDPPPSIYAATLRPRRRRSKPDLLDAWFHPLALAQPLPTLPLWLDAKSAIELPLEPSYQEVCRLLRIA